MGKIIVLFCLCVASRLSAQSVLRLDKSHISPKALDARISGLMDSAKVTGLAVVIFNNNKAVYQKCFGYGNKVHKTPLRPSSNMYGASLSKAVFSVLVMKLVEEGVLDLDKPLQSYLPKPVYDYVPQTKWQDHYDALKTDTAYREITARMCLDHTTGWPNWRWDESDQQLHIHRRPGTRYSYSGEGLVYLQFVLEKMLNAPLDTLMQKKIFKPAAMVNSAYRFLPRFENDYIVGHDTHEKPYEKDKDNEARAASTLETTVTDYAAFLQAVLQHTIISQKSTQEMFHSQIAIHSVQQMGPRALKDTSANDSIQLSYGLGWALLQSPYGTGAFKEGHGDGFQHYSILFPQAGTGVLIMSNSDNAESIFKDLLELTIADRYTPWYWENYIPFRDQKLSGTAR